MLVRTTLSRWPNCTHCTQLPHIAGELVPERRLTVMRLNLAPLARTLRGVALGHP